MIAHGLLPWKIAGHATGGRYISIADAKGHQVARVPFGRGDLENALRIVSCANVHDLLVAGLRSVDLSNQSAEAVTAVRGALARIRKRA